MSAEDVAGLLDRWRRARTRSQQLQVAAAGARALRSSSPADRRVLAQALVEHGAPQVAARLDTAAAGPLSAQDLTDLVGVLHEVEPATLEAVATAVADPVEHERLLASAAGGTATRPWDDAPPPPIAPPRGPAVELPPPVAADELPAADVPAVAAELPDAPAPELDPEPEPASDPEPAPDPEPGEAHAPTVDTGGVLAAIERAPRVLDRLREVTELAGQPLRGDDLVTILRALPDGWQRRTAAKRLLAAGTARDVDADAVLGLLGRSSDRSAVARTLVVTGHADLGAVGEHLPPAVATRLAATATRS